MTPFGFGNENNTFAISEPENEVVKMSAETATDGDVIDDEDTSTDVDTSEIHQNDKGIAKSNENSAKDNQKFITLPNNDVKKTKTKHEVIEELKHSLQYVPIETEGGRRDYPPELKKQMIEDFRRVQALNNKIREPLKT